MHGSSGRKSTRVLFLRHGHTDYPRDKYYNDELDDPPLNALGQQQAGLWKGQMGRYPKIAAIYASPSQRTQQTARLATEALGLPIQTIKGLGEHRFGHWGGLRAQEAREQFPEEWSNWKNDSVGFAPSGAETLVRFAERVSNTLEELKSRHPEECFLVVTHAGLIRMIVIAAMEMPLKNFKRLVIQNGSITEIEYSDRWPNLHSFSFVPGSVNLEVR